MTRKIIDSKSRMMLDETMHILHQYIDKLGVESRQRKSSIAFAAGVNAANALKPKA